MADSSDAGSIQSFQTENFTDEECKSSIKSRFFALYSFCPSSSRHNTCIEEPVSVEDANDQEDGSLSLSILATNMAATAETDLRKFLSSRLSVKTKFLEEGRCCSVGLSSVESTSSSAACYYATLDLPSNTFGFQHMPMDEIANSDQQQMFVVCFISFQDNTLDLFRTELDSYSQGLLPLLDKELSLMHCTIPNAPLDSTNNATNIPSPFALEKLTQLTGGIQNYLEQWPCVALEYLTRTLQCMGDNIHRLIHASLMNAALQISGATPEQEDDIKRFSRCCSLSSLLEQLQASDLSSITSSSDSLDIWQLQPVIIAIDFQQDRIVTFDKEYSCQFCKTGADKLAAFDQHDVVKIKDFLESIKLAFVHNLNRLKRFLKQAETDYYALYRALSYLRNCGCGEILLRYVKLDTGTETKAVLSTLENFIRSTNSTMT